MQLAIDATLVSPFHCAGHIDGVALHTIDAGKNALVRNLLAPRSRHVVRVLARAKAHPEFSILRTRMELAWREPLGRSSGVCCWREFLVGSPWGWWC